jgi:hypothetical protein
LRTGSKNEKTKKSISVYTNDIDNKTIILKIEAEVTSEKK